MNTDLIYVIYKADIELLINSIESISNQVRKVYLIDNTENKDKRLTKLICGNIEIIYLKRNFGIAYAQNVGIKKALRNEADFIMLSDQDTVYPIGYVEKMVKVFYKYNDVAAIAPKFFDLNKKGIDSFIGTHPIFFRKIFPKEGLYELMQSIASGQIINTKYLEKIGFMNEDLFIDWVDIEWCWRARNKGFKIIGNADVVIQHKLGDFSQSIGFREINVRNYLRHYYITRNSFYLSLYSNDLNLPHKITLFIKSFKYLIGFPLLTKPHQTNLRYVLLGFFHGLIKKMGKLNG